MTKDGPTDNVVTDEMREERNEYSREDRKTNFNLSKTLFRGVEAGFQLFDQWKDTEPEFALECLKEVRQFVGMGLKVKKSKVSKVELHTLSIADQETRIRERLGKRQQARLMSATIVEEIQNANGTADSITGTNGTAVVETSGEESGESIADDGGMEVREGTSVEE